ncbi:MULTISPECIES: hypothetical protein [Pacificibacter]|uniref:hypothetical protein n=1 Tax=Pacificibacter TaxID=1042323 RepID=UPI001C0A271E|nr:MULTISPECIES: hypothetical protein [Pacificibacter]MBU2937051.1 hypothetical protein [Pacificibacter marinus]MDO6616409.1 hypothetical protein [Pacificibacter sp. 1_MG-2023]
MSVSKDVRVKEYNGARSASSALKIEKVETQANIKVQENIASVGKEQPQPTSVGSMDKNVVDLKMDGKALNDFGVELTSGQEPVDTSQTAQKPTQDAPLKALQAETSGPSYKFLIGIAAGLVVVIAGLTIWSGGLGREEIAAEVSASNVVETETLATIAAQVVEPTTPAYSVDENEFVAQMTAGTIAALRTSSTTAATADAVGDAKLAAATLFSMVLDATAQDLSQPEIDHMLNMAYENGTIKVPEPFLLSSGRVNTNAIMTTFVGQ